MNIRSKVLALTSLPFIWAYKHVPMTFCSKVLTHTSEFWEKKHCFWTSLPNSVNFRWRILPKGKIYTPTPFIWAYYRVFMTFRLKNSTCTRRRWRTDGQTADTITLELRSPRQDMGKQLQGNCIIIYWKKFYRENDLQIMKNVLYYYNEKYITCQSRKQTLKSKLVYFLKKYAAAEKLLIQPKSIEVFIGLLPYLLFSSTKCLCH